MSVVITIVIGLLKWLVYTGLLWIMIKIQKLNYHGLGLMASSLAATAIGYIPGVGPYLAWAVLVVCLWKCTGADIAPDVLFTVSIAGALMFCVNLFVIGWLMGDPRDIGRGLAAARLSDGRAGMVDDYDSDEGDFFPTNMPMRNPAMQAKPVVAAAPARRATNNVLAKLATLVTRDASTAPAAGTIPVTAVAARLTLKGVTINAKEQSALIGEGRRINDVRVGDALLVRDADKTVKLTCEDITAGGVVFRTEDAQRFSLSFQ